MRCHALVFSLLVGAVPAAQAQLNIYIGEPGVSIGINVPVYPEFVRVPDYPVYYAPRVNSNLFFYDGLYWVYRGDRWYASSWYNGPWAEVAPEAVPVYVLRVPVRYYREPPAYFRSWAPNAPPRWQEHWGATWAEQRSGWDRWNRSAAPAPAPLPLYQKQYSGTRYPRLEEQVVLQSQQYRYRPREAVVQQYYQRSQSLAPGQMKKQQGAQSAKEFAPGQVKKREGAQSAKEFAPGQVKKREGEADRDGDDEGGGKGKGKGKGHGKGHGKD